MSKDKGNSGLIAIIIILGLLLVGGVIFYFAEKSNYEEEVADLTETKSTLSAELEELSASYDLLSTDNDSLNYKLELEKTKIQELLKEIKSMKSSSASQIERYKKEIASMKGLMKDYAFKVDSLTFLALQLEEENKYVKGEFNREQEKSTKLEKEVGGLKEVVAKAAVLEAMNLQSYPVNKRDKRVKRLGWTKKIKTEFTLDKNVTASAGEKEIYVVIKRPDNVTLSNPAGELFSYKDAQAMYTAKRTVSYGGHYLPVALFWDNDESLIEGTYKVEVIIEGAVVGRTSFLIK